MLCGNLPTIAGKVLNDLKIPCCWRDKCWVIEEVKNVSHNKLGVGSSDHASSTDSSGSVFMRK